MSKKLLQASFLLLAVLRLDSAVAQDCSRSCEPSCVREARETVRNAEDYLRECGAAPNPPPRRGNVELYKSDSCSDSLVAVLTHSTDCEGLSGERVWAISINGVCEDISDVDGDVACASFRAASSPRAVGLYKSDTCADSLVAYVDARTDCSALATANSTRVWAVRINGQCRDINDTSLEVACNSFGGGGR